MVVAVMKHMASNFAKLDKFEGVNFRRWQKKMHFLLSSMSVMYVLTTPMLEDGGDDATVEQIRKKAKWDNDDYVCRGLILNGSHLRIEESLRMQDSDKPKGNNVAGLSVVNMVEHNNSSRYNDNKGKRKHHDNIKADPNKKSKVTCWKCGKPEHLKKDCKSGKVGNKSNRRYIKTMAKKLVPLYVPEGLLLDKKQTQTDMDKMIAEAVQKEQETLRAELFMQVANVVSDVVPPHVDSFLQNYMSNNILHVHPTQAASSSAQDLQYQLYLKIKDDEQVRDTDLSIWWSLKIKFEKPAPPVAPCRLTVVRTRYHEDHHDDDACPEGENNERDIIRTHEQLDEFDVWMDDFGANDNEVPSEEVSPELLKEILGEVDEAQLQQAMDEMLRARLVRTLYNLGHERKYITEIMVSKADGKLGAITESDYKYLHKNDIEDLYLMCINVNLTAPTITFPGIERKKLLTITFKPVVGLIYENNKKEKRVMEIKEIPKFCDATLRRVLKLVEKKNKDVKHGYEDSKLSDNDVEYLRFYEEYIKDRLMHQDQMRR
ncbi:zinc finger, CCHC-type containing protein [Tanacetum coccineum]